MSRHVHTTYVTYLHEAYIHIHTYTQRTQPRLSSRNPASIRPIFRLWLTVWVWAPLVLSPSSSLFEEAPWRPYQGSPSCVAVYMVCHLVLVYTLLNHSCIPLKWTLNLSLARDGLTLNLSLARDGLTLNLSLARDGLTLNLSPGGSLRASKTTRSKRRGQCCCVRECCWLSLSWTQIHRLLRDVGKYRRYVVAQKKVWTTMTLVCSDCFRVPV